MTFSVQLIYVVINYGLLPDGDGGRRSLQSPSLPIMLHTYNCGDVKRIERLVCREGMTQVYFKVLVKELQKRDPSVMVR